ncbi:Cof-type HAD-IIB family hydrolase [Fictibacillus sp. WQ 8-8]|uniref:Cof-type HAD-IIB family hydrolase n=1 Tax=unclassified Fictibacillus TaxID=2644029 RepID=UPI001E652AC7|nr:MULTISPECIES: Cof-type HAD-IIB family hydrolase [unclassified Fictibacillus]MCQ6267053.1 Cof-type HAD-IIB family hydrolase [Fictibacillus sp. WQ 8-8]UZJ78216.1 Cof-type HAD-IIB family hydrolase [Fictibacillus sp. KU28468]
MTERVFIRYRGGIAMVYRMLILDIDGTLLRSNFRMDKETREAIDYVKKKGVYITLASGRNFPSTKKIAKALKLDGYLISQNGGFIASSVDEPFFESHISKEDTYRIVNILENYNCHIRLVHERFSVGNQVQQKNQLVAKVTLGAGDPLFYPVTFQESLSSNVLEKDITPSKIDVQFFEERERRSAEQHLRTHFANFEYTSSTKCNFEITSPNVTKANALRLLGLKLDVTPEEMVAVGDSHNDREMIEMAGLGVAMGNAPEDVKQAANWITRTNDQLGVPYMIKEVFRKQLRVGLY